MTSSCNLNNLCIIKTLKNASLIPFEQACFELKRFFCIAKYFSLSTIILIAKIHKRKSKECVFLGESENGFVIWDHMDSSPP